MAATSISSGGGSGGGSDGDENLLATAQRIVQSLNSSGNNVDRDDMLLIFSSFDNRLSNISSLLNNNTQNQQINQNNNIINSNKNFIDSRFESAESLILSWNSSGGDEGNISEDYLSAVDQIIQLTEEINLGLVDEGDDVSGAGERAESVLQLAMARLEDEFRAILIQNTVPLDADRLHSSSSSLERRSSNSTNSSSFNRMNLTVPAFDEVGGEGEGDLSSGRYAHARAVSLGVNDEDLSIDLVNGDALIELKEIADRMIRSGYEKECCQVYSSVRRDVLDECLMILGVEKMSIEEVQRMEWTSLDEKMRKWIQALKILVRLLLNGEKWICEEIFGGSEMIREVCFVETAKGCVMQMLNFGEAVAICRRSSEKLFRVLDMYDALAYVIPYLEDLFNSEDDDAGEMVCSEAKGVLEGLGIAAIGTFVEFESAVQGEASRKPVQNGDIHPLTRYVMNYVKLLVDYSETLDELLRKTEENTEQEEKDEGYNSEAERMSCIGQRLMLLIKSLESNLEEKSRLYEEGGLQYVFLMNNILYIVSKVKESELRTKLGDQWIRKRRGQVRQYATSYLRASWSKALSCLKDEGTGGSSTNASKVALKERFKNFNACFEDIYRIQTAWKVSDPQLREELRISISEKVIPAYRSFLGRFGSHLESGRHAGKYIKYTPDDLENYLLDLFEGSPLMLHHLRRKNS
ncbi:membrane traffic protein [Lithospermum erythrorhizon]|uniref:Exocyst subunit Exo70 family protein n=1 Tax=Lithospermum erythrorhizon TaxID=34254 RepID=A0AAV3R4K6_LITER